MRATSGLWAMIIPLELAAEDPDRPLSLTIGQGSETC